MKHRTHLLWILFFTLHSFADEPQTQNCFVSPKDGAIVGMKVLVRGQIPAQHLGKGLWPYIIVSPKSTNGLMWVQNVPQGFGKTGSFVSMAYCGTEDHGRKDTYKISAILAPKGSLRPGEFPAIPPGTILLDTVTVKRDD